VSWFQFFASVLFSNSKLAVFFSELVLHFISVLLPNDAVENEERNAGKGIPLEVTEISSRSIASGRPGPIPSNTQRMLTSG
jgi:hypothetical protein